MAVNLPLTNLEQFLRRIKTHQFCETNRGLIVLNWQIRGEISFQFEAQSNNIFCMKFSKPPRVQIFRYFRFESGKNKTARIRAKP